MGLKDLGLNFAGVKASSGSEPIPNGWHRFKVERWEETETGPNSAHPGSLMYKLGVSVVEGEDYANRWVFSQFTLDPKGDAFQQNLERLRLFFESAGIPASELESDGFDPTEEWAELNLIGNELMGKTRIKAANGEYGARNELVDYKAYVPKGEDLLV